MSPFCFLQMAERPRLGILISGSGTTMEQVVLACHQNKINMDPVCVVSSDPQAAGVQIEAYRRIALGPIDFQPVPKIAKTPDEMILLNEAMREAVRKYPRSML